MDRETFNQDTVVRFLTDHEGTRRWFMMEHVSRDNDLPAVEYADGSCCWYWMGVQHRGNDLPAVERANGCKEWWIYGNWVKTISADGMKKEHPRPNFRRDRYFVEQEKRYRKILKTSAMPRNKKLKHVYVGIADLTELFSIEASPFFARCFVTGNPNDVSWDELLFDKGGVNHLIDWFARHSKFEIARWESGALLAFDATVDAFCASELVEVELNGEKAYLWKLIPGSGAGVAVDFTVEP